jgi:hypothetical protein
MVRSKAQLESHRKSILRLQISDSTFSSAGRLLASLLGSNDCAGFLNAAFIAKEIY